jgi:hypothetical protein
VDGSAGHVYVAIAAERVVVRIAANGRPEVVARSGGGWSPSGGLIDRDGRLWVLEYDTSNAMRARRIEPASFNASGISTGRRP